MRHFSLDPFIIICLIIAFVFWILRLIKVIYNIFKYFELRSFFVNALKLTSVRYLYNIGWPWGGYKNILPEMLTILPESKTRVILLASRAIYSCIPRKRAIQYYYYYLYRALCVILLSNDHGWLPAAILSSHESECLWDVATVTKVGGA